MLNSTEFRTGNNRNHVKTTLRMHYNMLSDNRRRKIHIRTYFGRWLMLRSQQCRLSNVETLLHFAKCPADPEMCLRLVAHLTLTHSHCAIIIVSSLACHLFLSFSFALSSYLPHTFKAKSNRKMSETRKFYD